MLKINAGWIPVFTFLLVWSKSKKIHSKYIYLLQWFFFFNSLPSQRSLDDLWTLLQSVIRYLVYHSPKYTVERWASLYFTPIPRWPILHFLWSYWDPLIITDENISLRRITEMNKNRIELFIFMIFDIKFNKIIEHSTLFPNK